MSTTPNLNIYRRIITYIIMTLAVITLSVVLFFAMLGWRYNQNKNTFVQGGLVQFISQPSGANVHVDDITLANKTRSKITLNPGDYTVKMSLDGYRDWKKQATIVSGKVLWLNSARLIPNEPTTSSVFDSPLITSVAMQENGARIALMTDRTIPSLTLFQANDDTLTPKTITIPNTVYKKGEKSTFDIVKQTGDSKRLLVKHAYNDTAVEWLVIDEDAVDKSFAISEDDGAAVSSVQFDPSSTERAFVRFSDATIRRIDLTSGQRSPVLARNVFDFTVTSSGSLFYSTNLVNGLASTAYISKGKNEPRIIQTVVSDQPLRVAAGKYFDTFYIATVFRTHVILQSFDSFPQSDSSDGYKVKTTQLLSVDNPITFASFKADGRFVVLQQARSQSVYDIDLNKQYTVPIVGLTSDLSTPLQWLGTYHFWNDATGTARQYEFDGTNQEAITKVEPGFPAAYSQNEKYFYTIRKVDAKMSLQRTLMVIN